MPDADPAAHLVLPEALIDVATRAPTARADVEVAYADRELLLFVVDADRPGR